MVNNFFKNGHVGYILNPITYNKSHSLYEFCAEILEKEQEQNTTLRPVIVCNCCQKEIFFLFQLRHINRDKRLFKSEKKRYKKALQHYLNDVYK